MVGRLALWLQHRPRFADGLVALFWLLMSIATINFMEMGLLGYVFVGPAIVVAAVALFWRRTHPLLTVGIQILIVVVVTFVDAASPVPLSIMCGVYSVGAHYPHRTRGAQILSVGLSVAFVVTWLADSRYVDDSVFIMLLLFLCWIIGDNLRTHRAYRQSLIERAERAETLRDSLAHQAVVEERSRIARDLHDVVAHSMSIMVVQAGAAQRVASKNPEMATQALRSIEDVGRSSLNEMRRILGVLRGDERADHSPQPDIAAIQSLVDEFATAGLPVTLIDNGERCELPASLQLTAFRIVQESLTNVLKHAGDATATVTLECSQDRLNITVVDTGDGAATSTLDTGGQRGLLGMRERVASFDGRFSAGPTKDGYQVMATLTIPEKSGPGAGPDQTEVGSVREPAIGSESVRSTKKTEGGQTNKEYAS